MSFRLQISHAKIVGPGDHFQPRLIILGTLLDGDIGQGDQITIPTAHGEAYVGHILDVDSCNKPVIRVSAGEASDPIGLTILRTDFDPENIRRDVAFG